MSTSTQPKKRRGGRHPWATEEQQIFLFNHITGYFAAQSQPGGKGFESFWPPFMESWFGNWLLPELTPEEIASGVDQGDHKGEWLAVQKLVSGGTENCAA